jgi:hypothetical protein
MLFETGDSGSTLEIPGGMEIDRDWERIGDIHERIVSEA